MLVTLGHARRNVTLGVLGVDLHPCRGFLGLFGYLFDFFGSLLRVLARGLFCVCCRVIGVALRLSSALLRFALVLLSLLLGLLRRRLALPLRLLVTVGQGRAAGQDECSNGNQRE